MCNNDCTANVDGWSCSGGDSSTASTCSEVCGDAVLTASEECDDDNTDSDDGCDSFCVIETGFE